MRLIALSITLCALMCSACFGQVGSGVLLEQDEQAFALFGTSVAIDGEWMAVGAPWWDDLAHVPEPFFDSGSVSIYRRIKGQWVFHTRALPDTNDSQIRAQFGISVSLNNGYLFVGANLADQFNVLRAGRVRVYQVDAGGENNWGLTQVIDPPNPSLNARFGISVDSAGDRLVIGEYKYDGHGRVHVYQLLNEKSQWAPEAVLDPIESCRHVNREFGSAVAIDQMDDGRYALIVGDRGAFVRRRCPGDDGVGGTGWVEKGGAVHFYDTRDGDWRAVNAIEHAQANDGLMVGDELFGVAVDISSGYAVASAPRHGRFVLNDDGNGAYSRHGMVMVIEYNEAADLWERQEYFYPYSAADPERLFGTGIDIEGDVLAITTKAGNLLSFYGRHSGGAINTWGEFLTIQVEGLTNASALGKVVFDSSAVVIGASSEGIGGIALSFDADLSSCPVDINRDSSIDVFDVSLFVDAFVAQDSVADFTSDGIIDFFDVSAFLRSFANGCP